MKVIDLGHGELAIEPESPADSLQTLTPDQLQRSKVGVEAIDIYRRYVERTGYSAKVVAPTKLFSSF
jgi:hypothetical protein